MMRAMWCTGLAVTLLGACSGGGGGNEDGTNEPPTAPPPPPPPSSNVAFVGGWTGTTSQGRPFAMHIDEAGVALIMYGYSVPGAGCPQGFVAFIPFESPTPPLPINAAAFTYSSSGTSGSRSLGGSLTAAGSANGTLVINDTQCNGNMNATWTATKPSGATINLTGTWNGTFRSSLVPQTNGTLFLVQSGTTLSGTYTVPSTGAGGTVSGTVLGQTARFVLTQTAPSGCAGTFTGHAVLLTGTSSQVLFFFYAGADCLGVHTAGTGTGTQ